MNPSSWKYIRECQACGHQQEGRDPETLKGGVTDSWRDTKCKKCGSEALDWGSRRPTTPEEIAEAEADAKKMDQEYDEWAKGRQA